MIALGAKWRGIDMIWDFSTICNNDLFSEATNCQVITFHRWKETIFWHRWEVLPSNQGFLSIVSAKVSLEMLPLTKTWFSLLPQAPWPPWTNNSLILCATADLIVSLWRESPELHSVKWHMVHQLWAGRSSPPPAEACRWAPTPLPFPLENMVGEEDSIITTPRSICLTTPFILSPSLAPSQTMRTAAVYRCPVHFILVSHLLLSHLLVSFFFIIRVHLMTCAVRLYRIWVLVHYM